jgi:gluconate 2-dehydrogenase alpha chain
MAKKMKPVDAVLVGFGWTGALLGQELTDAGLEVLALERGAWRETEPDFAYTHIHDELDQAVRYHMMEEPSRNTLTFRNNPGEQALPMRRLGSFLPGTGVGGAGVHWNGQTWRFLPTDFRYRSHNIERYGKKAIPEDMIIRDWGVTYEELEPYYDKFEYLCGISGKAGNLRGRIQPGGNPFEGPRSRDYPLPPLKNSYPSALFGKATEGMGYHPFQEPAANTSRAYRNTLGIQMGQCTYCGFCPRYGCEMYAKGSAQTTILPVLMPKPNMHLRTHANVTRINTDASGKRATGVTYIDENGEECEQPADLVIMSAFVLHNVHLLLLSGIGEPYDHRTGKGIIGKHYAYQIESNVYLFFKDKLMNMFMGAGALGMTIDDFNGDNFDHSGLGFIGGGFIIALQEGEHPIGTHPTPQGTPKWGAKWKKAVAQSFNRHMRINSEGAVASYRDNFLDLDPNYTDAYGQPLLRMTFNFHDNEYKVSNYLTDRMAQIARAINPDSIKVERPAHPYDIYTYQSTHNTGRAIMGDNPKNSAVNQYLQSWDVPNLFIMGTSCFPQQAGYNPTGTLAALALRSADAIRTQYLKHPGPLVQA